MSTQDSFQVMYDQWESLRFLYVHRIRRRHFKLSLDNAQCIIDHAFWMAWKYWKRDKDGNNGTEKYAIGTYLNRTVRSSSQFYKELMEDYDSFDFDTDIMPESDDVEWLQVSIGKLSQLEQDVLHLRYFENQTLEASGVQLEISHEHVRKVEKTAISRLREMYEYENSRD